VEVVFPIEQPDLKQRVIDILKVTLADNVKARELLPDGTYRRVKPAEGVAPLRSQQRFMEMVAEAGNRAAAQPVAETPVVQKRVTKRGQRDKGTRR
jgi:polyphosphate kinase